MDWTVTDIGKGVTLVELVGRMDVEGALKADPAFASLADQHHRMVIDLSKLDFLASLGIRTLVTTSKSVANKGGQLVLLSPQPNIERTLRSSGIDTIIPIATGREAAEEIALR